MLKLGTGSHLYIKDIYLRYEDSHVKDKKVARLSYV